MIVSAVASPMTCAAQGQIVVTWTGGVSPFNIAWTGPSSGTTIGVTSPFAITPLAPGFYSITVTDASFSTATTSATVVGQPITNMTTSITYATIQDAVAASNDNEVIKVCAGTYSISSNLNITKAITLQGANNGVCYNVSRDLNH